MAGDTNRTPSTAERELCLDRVVEDVIRRRSVGEEVDDRAVIEASLELMPELQERLYELRQVEKAEQQAKSKTRSATTFASQGELLDGTAGPLVPDSFPGYELIGEIHRGGQGVVYQAVQLATGADVAIKVMREGPFAGLRDKARFEREVHILAQLEHPNIVTIHDSASAAGCHYFVMDYITGEQLDTYVAIHQLSVNDTLRLFLKVCEAVRAAHLRGVIHRDLKPGNILVDQRGEPRILDFGLSKLTTEDITDESQWRSMTMTGQFVGSLPWSSPEQADGPPDHIDLRTDVYSLGVIFYHILTGRFPYPIDVNVRAVLSNILEADPPRPSTLRKGINYEVDTMVLKCLAKERDHRYQSAAELAQDIQRWLRGEAINARPPTLGYYLWVFARRRKIRIAAISAVILLAATAFFWVRAEAGREEAEQQELTAQIRALNEQGRLDVKDERWEQAQVAFRDALALKPNDLRTLVTFVWMKLQQFKHQPDQTTTEALQEVDMLCLRVLDIDPDHRYALNYHGILLKKMHRYGDAIAVSRELVAKHPDFFDAWTNLGAYYALVGELQASVECLRRGTELAKRQGTENPKQVALAWRNQAALELVLSKPEAGASLEAALQANPRDVISCLLRVRLHLRDSQQVNVKEALYEANYADRLAEELNPKAKRMRALVHLRAGEADRAIEQAGAALKLGDMPTINHLILAIAHARKGNSLEARRHLSTAQSTWPEAIKDNGIVATYDEGVLWFESAAELRELRAEAEETLAAPLHNP